MPVNATPPRYKIEIQIPGGSSLDVTKACSGDSSGYLAFNEPEVDQNGQLSVTGKLSLIVSGGYTTGATYSHWSDNGHTGTDVFDPDLNQERWAVGNYVRIQVYNDSGVLVPYVKDYLRILKPPSPPYPGNWKLEIEVGDDLALLNWRSPDDDASGVTIGTSTSRTSIVGSILARAGFGNGTNASWAGTIANYGMSNSAPKTGGSWVDQAGAIAFTGKTLLWQNNQQQVLAKEIDLNPASPFLAVTLGQNEIDYQPVRGSEKPCSQVQVAGVGYELKQRQDEGQDVTEEYALACTVQELNNDGEVVNGSDTTQILVRRTTEQWYWDTDGKTFTRTIAIDEARGLSVPDSFYFDIQVSKQGSPFTVRRAENRTEISYYGENNSPVDGMLIKQVQNRQALNGKELGDFYKTIAAADRLGGLTDFLNMRDVSDSTTVYRYDGTQTRLTDAATYELIAKIAATAEDWADIDNPLPSETAKQLSQTQLLQWLEQNKDEWKQLDRQRQAGTTTGTAAVMQALVTTTDKSTISTAGQNQPPAAETVPAKFDRIEKQYVGSATLEPLAGADYAPRERSYRLDYCTSPAHCTQMAEILADWLQAKYRGFQITVPFSDGWLNYVPMSRIDVVHPSGKTEVGITSGVTFVLAANQAIVTANCMKIGILDGTRIQRPYKLKPRLTSGVGVGASIRILPYALTVPTAEITPGIGSGAAVSLGTPEYPTVRLTAGVGSGAAVSLGAIAASATHHWAFEDTSWSDSVGSATLTASGLGLSVTTGYTGNAVQFNGTRYLYRQDNTLSLNAGDWRITFYLYMPSFVAAKDLTGVSGFDYDEFVLSTISSSGNKLIFEIYRTNFTAAVSLTSGATLAASTWHAIEIERAGSTAYLRVNGSEVSGVITGTVAVSSSNVELDIGNAFAGNGAIVPNGWLIDEFKIFQ